MAKTEDELIEIIDKTINNLVYPKADLYKAYRYYNGQPDPDQFRYLEENFGIGSPTSVERIPLIKKQIDAIVGEYLETPILPKITCKDQKTITNIERDKHLKIVKDVYEYLAKHLNNSILSFLNGKTITDKSIEDQLNKLIEDININYVSEYEMAAQYVLQYIINSRDTDLIEKLRVLLLDLLITGYAFYKVIPSKDKNNIQIKVLDPLNTFIDRNRNYNYVKYSYRAVYREMYTKSEILNEYGNELTKKQIDDLDSQYETITDNSAIYVRSFEDQRTSTPASDGLDAGRELTPLYSGDYYSQDSVKLIPVYTVE